jgi:hypothetical protein
MAISEAIIAEMAADICASFPQLSDNIKKLPTYIGQDSNDAGTRPTKPEYVEGEPLLSLSLTTATVELGVHFIYRPGPFKSFSPRPKPTPLRPTPDSLYHIYYQLLNLEPILSLPANMKVWIQEQIQWIEKMGDPGDLERMKALVQSTRTFNYTKITLSWLSSSIQGSPFVQVSPLALLC